MPEPVSHRPRFCGYDSLMLPRGAGVARLFLLNWMVCIGVLFCANAAVCAGQDTGQDRGQSAVAPDAGSTTAQALQWRSGLTEINENWLEHDGDDLKWAKARFDDSSWAQVDLDDLGAATAGWRWYRKRVELEPGHPHVHLFLAGGEGTYDLYVNGVLQAGERLHSDFDVKRPTEQVFPLDDDASGYVLALRTRTPASYAGYHLPLFMSVTLGQPTAIDYERQALESQRLYGVLPSIAVNLALCLAAFGAFALFFHQQTHREYLYLGLYLLLSGLSDGLVTCEQAGVLPTSAGFLFGDPLTFLFSIAQIEFTFAFAGRRPGWGWRTYEVLLLCPLVLVALAWGGHFPYATYEIVEACITVPVALVLPVLLFAWWRRGNREAAFLIVPSMLPAGTGILAVVGSISIYTGWGRLDFLANAIPLGPVPVYPMDLGTLLFLLAIGVVMFFRFTRVSREQARTAAELEAAREIQQRLVPAVLPAVAGWNVEAAYLPAQEVGGDFYQVLEAAGGSTLLAVGDVSGKGLKAAMTGALAIGALAHAGGGTAGTGGTAGAAEPADGTGAGRRVCDVHCGASFAGWFADAGQCRTLMSVLERGGDWVRAGTAAGDNCRGCLYRNGGADRERRPGDVFVRWGIGGTRPGREAAGIRADAGVERAAGGGDSGGGAAVRSGRRHYRGDTGFAAGK